MVFQGILKECGEVKISTNATTGQSFTWRNVVIEHKEQYSINGEPQVHLQDFVFQLTYENATNLSIPLGSKVKLYYSANARKFGEDFYGTLRASKIFIADERNA